MSGLASAGSAEASAAASEAIAMDKLRSAGESQATASENLAEAGRAQAASTRNLAINSARQLGAIQAGSDAAKAEASAVQRQAVATVTASQATDRLAAAGQAQSAAVLQSLDVARAANDIASRASLAADRPWVAVSMPGDVEPATGQDYKIDLGLSNVGRSPALHVTSSIDMAVFRKVNPPSPRLDACLQFCQVYTIFPSTSAFQASSIGYHPKLPASSMTADEVGKLNAQDDVVLVRVRVDYSDSGGHAYVTTACYFLIPKFGFTSCINGNEAD